MLIKRHMNTDFKSQIQLGSNFKLVLLFKKNSYFFFLWGLNDDCVTKWWPDKTLITVTEAHVDMDLSDRRDPTVVLCVTRLNCLKHVGLLYKCSGNRYTQNRSPIWLLPICKRTSTLGRMCSTLFMYYAFISRYN